MNALLRRVILPYVFLANHTISALVTQLDRLYLGM
jgi:hypothetical protein